MLTFFARRLWLVIGTIWLAGSAWAGEPQLARVLPRGAQRGTEIEIQLLGKHLRETQGLLFDGPGIEVLSIGECKDGKALVTLRVAADCPLGMHGLRVRTRTGLSNLRTFSIGDLPVVEETVGNDSMQAAQVVNLGCTVAGVSKKEDADYYAFDGVAGERVSVEIEGIRLGDTLFDPAIALLDPAGFELGSCDDQSLLRQDASISVLLPRAGRYTVRVRECAYGGSNDAHYRLHLGRFPRPIALFPSGGRPGETLQAQRISADGTSVPVELILPELDARITNGTGWSAAGVYPVYLEDEQGLAPSPNWVRVADLPSTLEVEPNGSSAQATAWVLPSAVEGVISEPGDRDIYAFTAKKGEIFHLRIFARSLRSPLDALIGVRDSTGKGLKYNDDTGGPDSYIRFKVPADGEYTLVVSDQLGAGGPQYVYRLEAHRKQPILWLQAPIERQTFAVPRGAAALLMLSASRLDYDGGFEVKLPDLLPGLRAEIQPVRAGDERVPVVLHADSDAVLAQGLTSLVPTMQDAAGQPAGSARGGYRQDLELVLGRNRTLFWAHSVDRLPMAVVAAAPFAIEVEPIAAPLVQNGSGQIVVKLKRSEGFKGRVRFKVPYLPPGVNASQGLWIEADKDELRIPMDARANARLGKGVLVVEAEAYPGQGPLRLCSGLIPLEVRAPYVRFSVQAASVERGQVTGMHVKVERLAGFQGTAQVQVHGLPHHVSAASLTLGAEGDSLDFSLETQADSPLGRHKQLFCTARFETPEGIVMHRLTAAPLIINAPAPAKVTSAPKPKPVAVEAAVKKPKVLTRLEKLRLEHAKALDGRTQEGS